MPLRTENGPKNLNISHRCVVYYTCKKVHMTMVMVIMVRVMGMVMMNVMVMTMPMMLSPPGTKHVHWDQKKKKK